MEKVSQGFSFNIPFLQLRCKWFMRILLNGLLDQASNYSNKIWRVTMKWETPSYTDLVGLK